MEIPKDRHYDRVCAFVDLDAVLSNVESMRRSLPKDTMITGVIKTDGYGHGSVAIAKELEQEEGIWGYATATLEEAVQLKESGMKKPILLLGSVFPYAYPLIAEYDLRPAVFTVQTARELSETASGTGKNIKIHIKVDTGMNRIGMRPDYEGLEIIREIAALPGLEIEGIFTHFAKADETDKTSAYEQYGKFEEFVRQAEAAGGIRIPIRHCANSAGIVEMPDSHMDMVRAGIILYGLWPSKEVNRELISLKPAMSLKSRVVFVKEIKEGESVSYGGTFTAGHNMRIATVPVGYGDGYPRGLSGKGAVLIDGRRCPILGRICMDQFMVDITGLARVGIGTEVTLIGRDGNEEITMEELGDISGRFNYELACDIGKRVPRVYMKNGKPSAYKDYYQDVPTVFL